MTADVHAMLLATGRFHGKSRRPRRDDAADDPGYRGCMQDITFELSRDHVELNQLLKLAGLCDSGGMGKALVASGAVRVDGVVELRKTCKIRAGQVVEAGGLRILVAPEAAG